MLGDPFYRLLLTVAVFSFSSLLPGKRRHRGLGIWVCRSACGYVCVCHKNTTVSSLTVQNIFKMLIMQISFFERLLESRESLVSSATGMLS